MSDGSAPVFPCPFCRSSEVACLGGGRFLHFRCADCAENWTAMRLQPEARPPALVSRRPAALSVEPAPPTVH